MEIGSVSRSSSNVANTRVVKVGSVFAHLRSRSAILCTRPWVYWTNSENKKENALRLICKFSFQ